MSTGYLLGCMRSKFLRRKRILTLIFLGMLIAALGVIIVASVARNRELRTPWYAQRSAKIAFQQPVSPAEAYDALHAEYAAGTINGYALIADADTSSGIALGGQEGALWRPVNPDDERYSTGEALFWIHRQAVPARYFHNLEGLTASVNGFDLQCAGLTYYGLNWDWSGEQTAHRVSLRIDGQPAHVESPILALCVIMVILTLIGLIGTQLQLMNLYKQVAFSLAMTGMSWHAWKASWLSIFCLPLWLASLIGAFLGSAWKSVVMLERMNAFTPTAFAISVAIVLLSAIGILPTIGRWSRIDINEFRRLSE